MTPMRDPIGIFDSGVGGLSVLREVRAVLPDADLVYLADQARVPYGGRSLDEVQRFSFEAAGFLIERGARLVVVACNTASGAALNALRRTFPDVRFVGMEPAVKPAAERSVTRRVGVIATATTFDGDLFASLMERFAGDVHVESVACPELVTLVESGDVASPDAFATVERSLLPLRAAGVDTVVLGCTHYMFLGDAIARVAGPDVAVIDPAPAVARQVARVAAEIGAGAGTGSTRYLTTGDPDRFTRQVGDLLGVEGRAEAVVLAPAG
jgi:glutamate racemase